MSIGRPIASADRLEMTTFNDGVRNDFWWNDGACWSMWHDQRDDAVAQARDAGLMAIEGAEVPADAHGYARVGMRPRY